MAASSRWAATRCLFVLAGVLGLLPVARAADDAPPARAGADKAAQSADKSLVLAGFALGPLHAQCPEAAAALLVAAQQPEEPKEPAPPAPALDDRYRPHVAVAEIVGMGDRITVIAMVERGLQTGLWIGKPVRGPLIDRDKYSGVEHRQPLRGAGGPDGNKWEWQSYCNLILHAREVPREALAKAARHDVFYPNLLAEPDKFGAQPIHLEGRVKRMLKTDAPRILQNDGIRYLYEAWIFPDEKNAGNPYQVVFTELPKNAELGDKVKYYIACDAYFFKILRYEAPDSKDSSKMVRRFAPMLIGRSFSIIDAPKQSDEDSPFAGTLIPAVLILVGVLVVIFFVLTWWFRRGDRKVQARIREARYNEFVEPTDHPVNESSEIKESPARGGSPSGN